jgi:DNA replication and repair protein RecF
VALFGPNGAGKTNVLEAVSLLSPGRGPAAGRPEEMARRPEALGWKVTATLIRRRRGARGRDLGRGARRGQVRIDGKAAPQAGAGAGSAVLWLVPAMDRLWIEAPRGGGGFWTGWR